MSAKLVSERVLIILCLAAATAMSGCSSGGLYSGGGAPSPANQSESASALGTSMQTRLQSQTGGTTSGSVRLATVSSPEGGRPRVTVRVEGAPPNSIMPWHVHTGECGGNGPIVGPPGAYPLLVVDAQGHTELTTDLPFALPSSGSLYVNVHRSEGQMEEILACGNLAR